MTKPTLEQLELSHNDAWISLTHSAVTDSSQKFQDYVLRKFKKESNAYFQTKYREAFELFGTD